MEFKARPFNPVTLKTDCLVVVVPSKPGSAVTDIDQATGGLIATASKEGELKKFLDTFSSYAPAGLAAKRLVVISSGDQDLKSGQFSKLCAKIIGLLKGMPVKTAAISFADVVVSDRDDTWAATELARKIGEGLYVFDQCKSKKADPVKLGKLELLATSTAAAQKLNSALHKGAALARGINLARQLGDLPANICTPSHLANTAQQLAKDCDKLAVKVLSEAQMKQLKMGSLLSVTAGTETPAKLIVLEYRGGKKTSSPIALVGKGVTFDTGGISLKPGAAMDEMKYDMCGAASVLGTFATVAALNLPVNLVGIIPAVENMPSGAATKPGDIVTSMSGQTIEILNTDAEGRLILCDALTYAERFKPSVVIDIATLTGACVIALGNHATGLFSNNEELAEKLNAIGEFTGDRVWRLPLWEEYDEQLKSNFADMANIGGRNAGSVTAACFLARFTKKFTWAHLDIAGTAWNSGNQKGATGRPVALLTEFVIQHGG
ncbi:MAG: leucyl aminopeptidase [Porticoccaceae bacterium]|nr:leucyl aminopeptidase [Porticoccaceae bacterium]